MLYWAFGRQANRLILGVAILKTAPTRFLVYRIWDQWSWRQRFGADLSARGADDVGTTRPEFRRVHRSTKTHKISQMAAIHSVQWGMTKLDLGCFWSLCTKIHLGTFSLIVHTSFETWVTLFTLSMRDIRKRMVFRFKIHDYWRFYLQKVLRRADDLASLSWLCGCELIELTWHSLRELICWNILHVTVRIWTFGYEWTVTRTCGEKPWRNFWFLFD